jgi:nitrate reductase gamma subunit
MTILKWGAVTRAASGPPQRPGLPPAAAFWLVAGAWFLLLLAFSVPVVIAGVATTHFGLHQTAGVYSGALAVLAAAAAGSFLLHRRPSREQFSAKEERA